MNGLHGLRHSVPCNPSPINRSTRRPERWEDAFKACQKAKVPLFYLTRIQITSEGVDHSWHEAITTLVFLTVPYKALHFSARMNPLQLLLERRFRMPCRCSISSTFTMCFVHSAKNANVLCCCHFSGALVGTSTCCERLDISSAHPSERYRT